MAITSFTIDGVEVDPLLASFEIRETAGGISTLVCDVESTGSPVYRPALHDEVIVAEDGTRIFAGYITQAVEQGLGGAPNLFDGDTDAAQIVTSVTADDYSRIAERRHVTGDTSGSPATTLKACLQMLVDDYLDDYGVALHASQVDGPDLPELTWERVPVKDVLDQLSEATGYVWRIDYDKKLRMWAPGDLTAPFNINENDDPAKWSGDVVVERVLGDHYANRVILLVPGTGHEVTHTETFVAGTDGVTAGGETTYTATYPASQDIEQTWPNTITVGAVTGPIAWAGPPSFHDHVWKWNPMTSPATLIHDDSEGTTPNGTEITVTYAIRFPIEEIANDAAEQAANGIWEVVVTVDGMEPGTEAAVAATILAERIQAGDLSVTYPSRYSAPTLRAGQLQTITAPARNISGDLLITDIRVHAEAPDSLVRSVTLRRSQSLGQRWEGTYKDWLGGAKRVDTGLAVGTPSTSLAGHAAGNNTEVQFNLLGALGADPGFTYTYADNTATIDGTQGTVTLSGEATAGSPSAAFVHLYRKEGDGLMLVFEDVGGGQSYIDMTGDDLLWFFPGLAHLNSAGDFDVTSEGHFNVEVGNPLIDFVHLDGLVALDGLAGFVRYITTGTSETVDATAPAFSYFINRDVAFTLNLPALSADTVQAATDVFRVIPVVNLGTDDVVIDPSSTQTINGASTFTVPPGCGVLIQARNTQGWYVISSHGILDDGSVTNAKLADMAEATIKGRAVGAGTGDPTDLTATQATAILNDFVGDSGAGGTKGLVPAPAAGDAAANKYLDADGTWTVPSGSGDIQTLLDGISTTQGTILYYNGTDWVVLTPGTSGFFLKTQGAASNPVWATTAGSSATHIGTVNGRLTTETGVAVSTADRTAQSTIYFTPYGGNQIALYDGADWQLVGFSELSLALSGLTSGKNYDVYVDYNGGTPQLVLSAAWTNDTTRADALTTQDGVYVKSGATDHRYVGTIRTTGTTTTEDSGGGSTTQVGGKRFVWNYYNRVDRWMRVIDTTDSWAYTTDTVRQANGASGNQVEYVTGDAAAPVRASIVANVSQASGSGTACKVGVGVDSTSAFSGVVGELFCNSASTLLISLSGAYAGTPGLGYHVVSWNEKGGDGTVAFRGDNGGDSSQSGLTVTVPG